jgi:alpha-galactosidase
MAVRWIGTTRAKRWVERGKGSAPLWLAAALGLGALAAGCSRNPKPGEGRDMAIFHSWALRPPMGYNSWDSFATTITEVQVKAQADYMALHLARHGWQYIVVDIQWYEPNATGFEYREGAELALDSNGRLLPAAGRFPCCREGFRPLADYVHGKGLKFGLHLMRGIPRKAVEKNLPIADRSERARDIADVRDTCAWNPDMFGVDMSKPGAQAYYDSVFAQFAAWGVDYVKVDDISRPYHDNIAEIEAIRAAIDRSGRPMVLSLSPGATALSAAEHVKRHANLWRISDDFWDNWDLLREQFERLRAWNPHRGPGHWPDADMLPFGVLDLGRRSSRFTPDEHFTVMTLWAIARSPLMHGGDMTKMDDFTLSLLSNDEVLAVNQASTDNRPLFDRDGLIAWIARPEAGNDRYLALFNARDRQPLDPARARFSTPLDERASDPRRGFEVEVSPGSRLVLVADDGEGGNGGQHAVVWADPRLSGPLGELRLGELPWVKATTRWGNVMRDTGPGGRALRLAGADVKHGFGVHTKSVIEFVVPEGYQRLTGACGFEGTPSAASDRRARCLVFVEPATPSAPSEGLPIAVALDELGIGAPVRVRDLWRREDLGPVSEKLEVTVPWHGARLFRLSASSRGGGSAEPARR